MAQQRTLNLKIQIRKFEILTFWRGMLSGYFMYLCWFFPFSDILSVSFYPNPENNTLPFSFFTGNDPLALYNFFERSIQKAGASFFWQNMDYEL